MKHSAISHLLLVSVFICLTVSKLKSQTTIWQEKFSVAEKGFWQGGKDTSDVNWTMQITPFSFFPSAGRYVKTVSTSKGRMEAWATEGEAVWKSEIIDISKFQNVSISAKLGETGSSNTTGKYVKIYYKIDTGAETLFSTNGEQIGNFGKVDAKQTALNGNKLQIIVKISNSSLSQSNKVYFDEIFVKGEKKGNNKDSQLSEGNEAEPSVILSSYDDADNMLQVFDFKLTDAGSGDNLPTKIKELKIKKAALNQLSDWKKVIAGARLYGGNLATDGISANIHKSSLDFKFEQPISIADGKHETFSLKIFLKSDLSKIKDGENIDFKIDSKDIKTDKSGSSFATGKISSGAIRIDIKATKLVFQHCETAILTAHNFTAKLVATDDNGNIDTEFNENVKISASKGSLTAASGLKKSANAGIVEWSDLQFNTEVNFKLIASSSGLAKSKSSLIYARKPASSIHTDFEDGELNSWWFTNDWTVSKKDAISGSKSLKHNLKDVKGISCISHNLADLSLDEKTVIWRFKLKNGNWDPSTQNGFWFYLLANENNLISDSVDGYAVGIQLNAKGAKDSLTLWKVTDGKANTALLTADFDWGKSDAIGIKVERSPEGEWSLSYYENTEFSEPNFVGTVKNIDYEFHDCCGLVFKFRGSKPRAGELWLDDLSVILDSKDSKISEGEKAEPSVILSSYDNADSTLQVLDFQLTDAGSGDNLPTKIKELNFTKGSLNQVADWQLVIAGAKLYGGNLKANGISASIHKNKLEFTFEEPISIADGDHETFNLKIFLKSDLSKIKDGQTFDFKLDSKNIVTDENASSFADEKISSGAIKIDIQATKLVFRQLDTMILTSQNFTAKLVAIDDNGNIDADFNQNVKISASSGNIAAASGLTKLANHGITEWSDLQCNAEVNFKLIASTDGLANAESKTIFAANPTKSLHCNFENNNLNGWWFTNDWTIADSLPISGSKSLKHNLKDVKGISCISHNLADLSLDEKTVIWRFNLKNGNWDPSTQNGFWFYLLANEKNLISDSIDGYSVGIQLNAKGAKDSLTLWKVTDGKADKALLTAKFDWNKNDAIGIKVERSAAGEWSLSYYENTEFREPNFVGTVKNTDYEFNDCCGLVFKFKGSKPRAGELWLDDLSVILDSKDSKISEGEQAEPSVILSSYDNADSALQVLDFKLIDAGSGDSLPTRIKYLSFTQAELNEVADWQAVISGAKLYGGNLPTDGIEANINPNNLEFELEEPISIADGEEANFSLKIFLKADLSKIKDAQTLDFKLDSKNIATDENSSSFADGEISSEAIKIDIQATKLVFKQLDTMILTARNFTAKLVATDDNGNIDADFNQNVKISASSGNIAAALGLKKLANAGIAEWSDLQCNKEVDFKLIAHADGLEDSESNTIFAAKPTKSLHCNFENDNLNGWWFTNDWTIADSLPISGSKSLKHNLKDVKGSSCISHNLADLSLVEKTVIWRFNLKNGNWDPSTQNGFWFYLLSNEKNLLSDSVDGYSIGIQLDAKGSADSLTLWKVTDGKADKALLTADFDWNSNDAIGIKVERSAAGEWSLSYYENTEFREPNFVGTVKNTDYEFHDCCGLVFKFRGSTPRAGELWMDDLSVILDSVPPKITEIIAKNDSTIFLQFSEILNKKIAQNIGNYLIAGIGKPISAKLLKGGSAVILNFNKNLEAKKEYILSIKNIADISRNVIDKTVKKFVYLPFAVEDLYVKSKNELLIVFSHKLAKNSAVSVDNFLINNDIGKPLAVNFISDSVLHLQFKEFAKSVNYSLTVSDLTSQKGMVLDSQVIDFEYYPGNAFDIVINEIMSDVSPPPSVLPNFKYVELYNRSEHEVDLANFQIQFGNKRPKKFKRFKMKPDSYLLLCAKSHVADFERFGSVMGVLSESQLVASGTQISLTNSVGELVDYVQYSEKWHIKDAQKSNSFSLERIDANNFCGGKQNWQTSTDFRGGTPCEKNSVSKENKNNNKFKLLKIIALTPFKLALCFNKNIEANSALNPANYELNNSNIRALFVNFADTARSTVVLQFANQFENGKINELIINLLSDFCGNEIEQTKISFSYFLIYPRAVYPEASNYLKVEFSEEVEKVTAQMVENYELNNGMGKPKFAYKNSVNRNVVYLEFANDLRNQTKYELSINKVKDLYGNEIKPANLEFVYFVPSYNDLIINEILFNPKPNGVDFVEIYNKAKLPVDLSKMYLARRNDEGKIESKKQLATQNSMLKPMTFLCISSDSVRTKLDYPAAEYEQFVEIPVLPAYNDDAGTVLLMYGDSIIDEFSYNEKMHFKLIAHNEGVSLERIDPFAPSSDADNWHSAAFTAGFATPANKNSQYKMLSQSIDKEITVEPETFSPDNDGRDDLLFIRYKFPEAGYVANVHIYSSQGKLIKRLVQNELLGIEGEFSWDGLQGDNRKAKAGIYVIYFEVFNLDGIVRQTKKICVLAMR